MPSSDDRFYLLEMSNRPVLYGDVGSLIRVEGVIVGGGGTKAILMLPGMMAGNGAVTAFTGPIEMSIEDWSDFIRRSDNPEILIGPKPNGMEATIPKIFQRKLRYEISGAIQQKIWAADGFQCVYCGRKMGEVLMTIDHFVPLELGGTNDATNFVTACKPCNKDKGSQDPKAWRGFRAHTREGLEQYLASRQIKV